VTLASFSVVLLGDSFPVQSIKTEDFVYRHRALKETMRVPVAIQAENAFVSMQILPERFEITVRSADHLPEQIEGVKSLLDVFLEYVGKRTISALGHNVSWEITGSEPVRHHFARQLTASAAMEDLLGRPATGIDIAARFDSGIATTSQANIATMNGGDAFINFNFHYDLTAPGLDVRAAIDEMESCLQTSTEIGRRADLKSKEAVVS
jgi:hypothetical protein